MPAPAATVQNGLLLMLLGSVVDSSSGLFTRLIGLDGFTVAWGRATFAFLLILAFVWWRKGRGTWAALAGVGVAGCLFVTLNALGMIFNMLSLANTAVANFYMIFATAPFAAALAARFYLGERVDAATMLAASAGFAGIVVMMASGVQGGGLLGEVLAVGSVLTYAALTMVVRRNPAMELLPVIALAILASAVIAFPFADIGGISPRNWGLLAAFGMTQLAVGNILVFAAMARIPAALSGLLGILNAAFAPLWVFLVLGEVPPRSTIIGGAIILSAAVLHLCWTILTSRRAPAVVTEAH